MAGIQKREEMHDHMICCKSQFKLHCSVCNQPIHRGSEITQLAESRGLELRARTYQNGSFYTPFSRTRWIHKFCSTLETHGQELNMYLVDQWSSYPDSDDYDNYYDSDENY